MHQPAPQARPRILGFDFGSRRVGVAITDPLGFAAHPLLTLGGGNFNLLLKNIGRLVRKYEIAAAVVGNPVHMSGVPSTQAVKTLAFATALRETLALPVHLQDERLTSLAAHEVMDRLGLPRGPARKAKLDQYAAVVILQDWLDTREHASAPAASGPLY